METGKILEIWVERSYGFYNWWYMIFEVWKKKYYWNTKKTWMIEDNCKHLWIYNEDDMKKLANKRFKILYEIKLDEWWTWYKIEIINKKINPDKKTIWIYDDTSFYIN